MDKQGMLFDCNAAVTTLLGYDGKLSRSFCTNYLTDMFLIILANQVKVIGEMGMPCHVCVNIQLNPAIVNPTMQPSCLKDDDVLIVLEREKLQWDGMSGKNSNGMDVPYHLYNFNMISLEACKDDEYAHPDPDGKKFIQRKMAPNPFVFISASYCRIRVLLIIC
ncbi:hypothetical protein Dsin_003858 [Dipteronia sinensis]|uniref:PAS domain-containing protein n=1 Tax=Dipteronia sinensis TaxID=43782 RepID=A0AAE0B8V5_9ROSI|nr:hypothetical protein Dsin_003858 [Dipteronia sinensis]